MADLDSPGRSSGCFPSVAELREHRIFPRALSSFSFRALLLGSQCLGFFHFVSEVFWVIALCSGWSITLPGFIYIRLYADSVRTQTSRMQTD